MFNSLKQYCKETIPFTDTELQLVDQFFNIVQLKKKAYLQQDNKVCDFIAFISDGCIRHFHVKDGLEKTCDISFENSWVTDFQSFNSGKLGVMNLQAMEDSTLILIRKESLHELYAGCSKYESFGRIMAERVAQRATSIAMSLSSDKPEERFQQLLNNQPDLFQRIPLKYIANFLGVSPESLSRIRKRVYQKQKS